MRRPRAVFARCRGTFREAPCGRGRGRAAAAGGRADPPGRTPMARRPWPRLPQRAPMAARSQRSCARPPRRAQFRPRPFAALKFIPCEGRICAYSRCAAAAAGRAGASSPHIPWPRVRSVSVHDRRGRARRRDGPALLHPTSPGRAFASFLCTIAAGVRSSGRAFAALKFIPCAGRICAYSRCAAAASASAQSVRSQGRSRSARPKWP